MKPKSKLHLRLILDVIYDLQGEASETVKDRIDGLPRQAAGEGLLTGDGPAVVDEWRHELVEFPSILRKPWSPKQIQQRMNQEDYIEATVPVSFRQLTYGGIDALNDAVEDYIVGDAALLSDIAYTIVGTEGEKVLLKVTAQVESLSA